MRKLISLSALAVASISLSTFAAADELNGTYKMISAKRQIVDTGEVTDAYGGPHPNGTIIYGRDGRFLALVTFDGRAKPESILTMTDQQRADLFRSMLAYGGTYSFDGAKVEHHIDISWNEVWTGTTVIRDIKKEGDKLIYTTRPAPFSSDGKMSVVTVVFKKITPVPNKQ